MEDKLTKVKSILSKYNQEHLLRFFDEISEDEKNILLNQLLSIDFDLIIKLYENSKINKEADYDEITPLPHIEKNKLSKEEINSYTKIGEDILKNNQVAVVTMAGGQGTRLGYKGPKGTYELKFAFFKKSLFEIICDNLKMTNDKYNIVLPWYIMTSQENNFATQSYFKEHNYFNYPKESIKFFTQDYLPIVNLDGDLILQEPYLVKTASCGNGNVFKSLEKAKIIEEMKNKGIKWISFGGIDNILFELFIYFNLFTIIILLFN